MECDIEFVIRKGKIMCSWDWDILVFYNGIFYFKKKKKNNELLLNLVKFIRFLVF